MPDEFSNDPAYQAWLDSLELTPDPRKDTHMKVAAMTSRFLTKEDCKPARRFTIMRVVKENVAPKDKPPEMKWVLYAEGEDRGFVANKTNLKRIAVALGTDESSDWVGRQIVLVDDPTVEFGGDLVGGIRVRIPVTAQAAEPTDEDDGP